VGFQGREATQTVVRREGGMDLIGGSELGEAW
jgi:hypothetical protein